MGDGEDAVAALCPAGRADEVLAAALGGEGQGGVYDLDQRAGHYFTRARVPANRPLADGMRHHIP